jgi:murein DD-endopeptidase MepM/ murein hydrolase activator NlpD
MMAGTYSIPMAGGGLPPATGVTITVDLSMFVKGETIISVDNGQPFMALILPEFEFKPKLNVEGHHGGTNAQLNALNNSNSLNLKLPGEGLPTLLSPVGNAQISSAFLAIRGCIQCSQLHAGTDYSVGDGTRVFATAMGKIVRASFSPATGNTVIIHHGASYENPSFGVYTLYAHGSKFVKTSGYVGTGELIMYSGHSGEKVTGPHLHYEVIVSPFSPSDSRFYSETPWSFRYGPETLRSHLYGPN